MRPAVWHCVCALAVSCILQSHDAIACGVAYPQGSFAKFSNERTLIVWDAAKKTEHFVRALSLKGDPESFGVFVPTPTLPTIAKESDALLERVAKLFARPEPPAGRGLKPGAAATAVEVLQRAQIGDFEAVTLKAADASSLGDWLARNKFVDKPALRQWEKTYLDKKWLITAVRCTARGAGDRSLEVPTMRLSFVIDAPFFPYTEVPPDAADEASYRAKYGAAGPAYGGGYYGGTRPFDVYVVAATPMQALAGQPAATGGPPVIDAVRVSGETLQAALGDTKAWGFDTKGSQRWVVTHLSENTWMRNASSDLTFAAYDLPKPRPGPGLSEIDDRPAGATFPHGTRPEAPSAAGRSHKKLLRIGALFLFLLMVGTAGWAVVSEQRRKKDEKNA